MEICIPERRRLGCDDGMAGANGEDRVDEDVITCDSSLHLGNSSEAHG